MSEGCELGEKMSAFDLYAFNNIIGDNIRTDNPEHQLLLKWYKTAHGFIATCSCGVRIGKNSMTGNNRAGWDWGLSAIKQKFNAHVAEQEKITKGAGEKEQ